jgi:ABC-type transport system involved in cytochrome c biogenesis permease subunit
LILIFYIFFSNSILLKTTLHKFIFASFTIYSTAITPEIWLTTLQSKVFFGMLSFIMIFQNFSKFDKKKFIIYRGALILNGLSSIFSSIFSIVYFFIYVKERSRINFYNFIFSLIPLLVNFFIFLYFSLKNLAENDRFTFELEKIFNLVYNTSVRPIFGGNLSKLFYGKIAFLDIKF